MTDTTLHHCLECGRIAEWHYIIARSPTNGVASPKDARPGTKCWAPGEGVIGVEPHILTPDYAHPIKLTNLPVDRAVSLVGMPRSPR